MKLFETFHTFLSYTLEFLIWFLFYLKAVCLRLLYEFFHQNRLNLFKLISYEAAIYEDCITYGILNSWKWLQKAKIEHWIIADF